MGRERSSAAGEKIAYFFFRPPLEIMACRDSKAHPLLEEAPGASAGLNLLAPPSTRNTMRDSIAHPFDEEPNPRVMMNLMVSEPMNPGPKISFLATR